MDIQKAKDSLDLIMDSPDDFLFTAKYLREYINNALSYLEKPMCKDIKEIISILSIGQELWEDNWEDQLKNLINQYAETYHDKKCAECIGKLPAFPLR